MSALDLFAIAFYCWACTALSAAVVALWQWAQSKIPEAPAWEVRGEAEDRWQSRAQALEAALGEMGYAVVDVTTDDDEGGTVLQVVHLGEEGTIPLEDAPRCPGFTGGRICDRCGEERTEHQ